MGTEANRLVIRRLIEEVVNTGNVERLAEFIPPDCRQTNDPTGQEAGLGAMRAHILAFRQTFPDVHLTVEHGGAVNMREALFSIGTIHAAGRCDEGAV